MKPVDYRNETFDQVKERMEATRLAVWQGMLHAGGSNTTREWAGLLDIDLLTVRPRITELVQMGFVKVVGGEKGQGLYRACTNFEAMQHHQQEQVAARQPQLELKL